MELDGIKWVPMVVDTVRTIAATFVGAGLAFILWLRQQKIVHDREQIAAGNSALITLARQLNSSELIRRAVGEELEKKGQIEGAPNWLRLRPIQTRLEENFRFDFGKLDFLVESENPGFLIDLHVVESNYLNLVNDLKLYLDRHNDAQVVFSSKLNVSPEQLVDISEIEKCLELPKLVELTLLANAIIESSQKLPNEIQKTSVQLHQMLKVRFAGKKFIRPAVTQQRNPSA